MRQASERHHWYAKRAHAIYHAWRFSGATLKELGSTYGVTRERIRQIVERELARRRYAEADGTPAE